MDELQDGDNPNVQAGGVVSGAEPLQQQISCFDEQVHDCDARVGTTVPSVDLMNSNT